MFLSIIIPVYNSTLYLSECVNSLLNQSFKDFEILLVDDQSTDNSPDICRNFANSDARVKYIQRAQNGGTSAARNTGLRAAKGKYVTFTDNDDYWRFSNAISDLYQLISNDNEPDVVIYPTCSYWESRNELIVDSNPNNIDTYQNSSDFTTSISSLIESGLYCSAVWSKTVKRQLIVDNSLFFLEGKRNEDCDWSLRLLYQIKSVKLYNSPFYVWRRNSAVSQSVKPLDAKIVKDLFGILHQHCEAIKTEMISKTNKAASNAFAAYLYVVLLGYAGTLSKNEANVILDSAIKCSWLLSCSNRKQVRICRCAARFIGLTNTSKLLGLLMNRERRRIAS